MAKKPKLNFEDIAFSEWAEENSHHLELPLSPAAFRLIAVVALCVFVIVFGRLFILNIYKGDFYQTRATVNVNKEIILPASRGLIVDRFGEPLMKNVPILSASLVLTDFLRDPEQINKNLKKIADILEKSPEELREILQKVDPERSAEVTIVRDINLEQAIALKALGLDALRVKNDFRRQYLNSLAFAHLLGYIGVADKGDILIGKSGLEATYDEYLRGVDGRYIIHRDVLGNILEERTVQQPRSGYQLNTTIDADLQNFFYRRFKQGLDQLNRNSGAGIAMNPKTGEILALLSFPSYDNNRPADFLKNKNQPLFNRAVSGIYSPGSIIKPFVAAAALNEGVVEPADSLYSAGYLEIPNPYYPDRPSRFLDWKPHGYVDVFSALAKSSNVYFYIVGGGYQKKIGLGVERLLDYWKKFRLGELTGIDLPGEKSGFLYGPEEKEEKLDEIWRVGDTYNISIGQGNLAVSPIRMLTAYAGLAMDGKVPHPFITESVIDERDNLILINQPSLTSEYSELSSEIHEVKKGLQDAVRRSYGTAHMLNDLIIDVAGKTGSAQIANNTKTNAFFAGYAPANDPELAILILIENAREGSVNTLPIAYDVFNWYYWNRIIK